MLEGDQCKLKWSLPPGSGENLLPSILYSKTKLHPLGWRFYLPADVWDSISCHYSNLFYLREFSCDSCCEELLNLLHHDLHTGFIRLFSVFLWNIIFYCPCFQNSSCWFLADVQHMRKSAHIRQQQKDTGLLESVLFLSGHETNYSKHSLVR